MSTSVRRIRFALMHIRFLILVAALLVSTALTCQAGGTYRNGPMFVFPDDADTIKAGMPSVSLPSMQNETAGDFVGGCGRGRFRDERTRDCSGPADIR
jgi:hypothetical protein